MKRKTTIKSIEEKDEGLLWLVIFSSYAVPAAAAHLAGAKQGALILGVLALSMLFARGLPCASEQKKQERSWIDCAKDDCPPSA